MTLDPQGFSHTSQCCSPFTLNLKPKPSCSFGDTVGLVCCSAALYLFRQCVQPLNFLRPQHVTDQIVSVSCAGFMRDSALCCNPHRALRPINVQMSKQCDNLSLIFPSQEGEAELQRPEKLISERSLSETLIQRNTGICWWMTVVGDEGGDFR